LNSTTLLNPGGDPEQRWLKQIATFLGLIFGAIVLTFCFFASSLCITIVLSAFLAILVDPLVVRVAKIGLGRVLASGLVVLCFMLLAGTLTYVLYNRASAFADEFPSYAYRIQRALAPLASKFERFEKNAQSIAPLAGGSKHLPEVTVKEGPTNWPSYLVRGVGSISGVLIMGGVLPFLVFFMLVTKDQMSVRLVNMFEGRIDVPKFVSNLGNMIRGFVLGNLIVGSIMAAGTSVVFLVLGMKGAVTLGIVSAFLNLIPFLGVLLATAVPLAAALLQFNTLGPFITIVITVLLFHLIAANLLIPKLIGSRLLVGPVAVTIGMLFWGWLWGIMGLLLAVPLTAFIKLIADSRPSLIHLSNLLTEDPRPIPGWARFGQYTIQRVRPYLKGRTSQKPIGDPPPSSGTVADNLVSDPRRCEAEGSITEK
jgi:predicted PurR-regulated permease PerM